MNKIKSAPKEPGVYLFYGNHSLPLYIGKAVNLRDRLKSYLKIVDAKTESLHTEATRLKYLPFRSEIEALIQESRLIKELKPKYNILWRDDKSYHYVYFTRSTSSRLHQDSGGRAGQALRQCSGQAKENFPKIFIAHASRFKIQDSSRIGPFTDGAALRLVMKLLRRYFPYCTCLRLHFRDCLNSQIGLCLGYCCKNLRNTNQYEFTNGSTPLTIPNLPRDSYIRNNSYSIKQYSKNIRTIKMTLCGQTKKLLKNLTDPKEKLALEKILEHKPYIISDTNTRIHANDPNESSVDSSAIRNWSRFSKIECYDISHLSGKEAVGAMTVLKKIENRDQKIEFVSDKNSYRKFRIRSAPAGDDPRAIAEILQRRLNHPEWSYPDLIIMDGGLIQYRVARKVLEARSNRDDLDGVTRTSEAIDPRTSNISLISFAKPQKLIYGLKPDDKPTPLKDLTEEFQKLIEQAIYQTHNFAIRYHRKVRSKNFML